MQSKLKKLKLCVMAVGGTGSEASLLYIAWSKYRDESLNFLRKQLSTLHCFIIAAGTRALVNHFKEDPTYDFANDDLVGPQIPAIFDFCKFVWQDLSTFLN